MNRLASHHPVALVKGYQKERAGQIGSVGSRKRHNPLPWGGRLSAAADVLFQTGIESNQWRPLPTALPPDDTGVDGDANANGSIFSPAVGAP